MKIKVLSKFEKVDEAIGYQTAWDSSTQKYIIIAPNGKHYDKTFSKRILAEKFAIKVAKFVFHKRDKGRAEELRSKVLGNELNEQYENINFKELDVKFDRQRLVQENDVPVGFHELEDEPSFD